MTTIRDAILKAADHIERNPVAFDFQQTLVPNDCGTPGCALGWMAFFYGEPLESYRHANVGRSSIEFHFCVPVLGMSHTNFYQRLDGFDEPDWRINVGACARALRLYADKYHPAAPVLFPDWNAMAAKQTVSADAPCNAVAS